jgi:hypothetical protein
MEVRLRNYPRFKTYPQYKPLPFLRVSPPNVPEILKRKKVSYHLGKILS